jgi:hypothetical protein
MTAAADPVLTDIFRSVRRDARSDPSPVETAETFNIEFAFDGVGQPPTPGDTLIWTAGRKSGRLVGAQIVADAVGSATIDLRIGTIATWPANAAPYDAIPALSGAAAEIDVTGWSITSLQPMDVLAGVLITVTAPITCVTLTLIYRLLKWPSANPNLIDSGNNDLVLDNGNSVSLRG